MGDGSGYVQSVDIRQIAGALGITKRSAERRAIKESWQFQEHATLGGKRHLYPLGALPAAVQSSIRQQHAIAAANSVICTPEFNAGRAIARRLVIAEQVDGAVQKRTVETGQANAAALTGNSRARMEAKLDVLARLDAFARSRSAHRN